MLYSHWGPVTPSSQSGVGVMVGWVDGAAVGEPVGPDVVGVTVGFVVGLVGVGLAGVYLEAREDRKKGTK